MMTPDGLRLGVSMMQLIVPAGAFVAALVVTLALRRLLLRWFGRGVQTGHPLMTAMAETLRVPSILWCLAAALDIAFSLSELPPRYTVVASKIIVTFLILSISLFISSALARALTMQAARRGVASAVSGLSRTLIHVTVLAFAALALMRLYHLEVGPLLTALGVGGLAVALALRDTLENFFAGIHILIEEPISVGGFIRLSEQEEGVVTDIGWRTTRIRNGRNNIIVVPNSKITTGIIVNYNLLDPRVVVEVPLMVGYSADTEAVSRMAREEMSAVPGILREPAPSVFLHPGFLPTHVQLTLVFSVKQVGEQVPAQSELRHRLLKRLRQEGVPLPKMDGKQN